MNFIFLLPILIILNLFFPILNKFIKKFKTYKIDILTEEDNAKLIKSIMLIEKNFKVEEEFIKGFYKSLEPFIKKEIYIIQDIKTNEYHYLKLRHTFRIIELAKEAITMLDEVHSGNKKIAYYESAKNSNLDKLIEEYTKQLNEQDHKKFMLLMAKKEIKFKRVLAKLQKKKSLFFNFYLTIFSLYPIEELKFKKQDEELIELMKNLFEFYRVGHATKDQIYKSVAIQIFNIYKNDFEKEELKRIIGDLITYSFSLNNHYQNFNNIVEQAPYIKNLIYKFPIFECSTEQEKNQKRELLYAFVLSNSITPRYIPKFLRIHFFNKYLSNLLNYYQLLDNQNFFGIIQIKK